MQATTAPSADPARTGAVWVAATGAFLLLAAASLFVAVRWHTIPDRAKLAAVLAMTGAFLFAGHRGRPALPATSGVLWHVGALLLPLDVAALARHGHAGWGAMLLVEGAVCLPGFALLGRVRRSTVLDAAATIAGVAFAGGVGALTIVPAPVALVGLAALAAIGGQRRDALSWSLLAGLAPVLALVESAAMPAHGVLATLGLVGPEPRLSAVITGAVAALIVGSAARARGDAALAVVAAAIAVVGAIASASGIDGSVRYATVGIAAFVVIAELVGLLSERDPFWSRPAGWVALTAEGVGALGAPVVLGYLLAAPLADRLPTTPITATALALLAVAAVLAGQRRGGRLLVADGVALATAVAAVVAATESTNVIAAALGIAAIVIARRAVHASTDARIALAIGSVTTLAYGVVVVHLAAPALVAAVAVLWVVGALLDDVELGFVARTGWAVVLLGAITRSPREALLVAAAAGLTAAIDALRRDEPDVALVSAVALTLAVAEAAAVSGLTFDAVALTFAVVATIVGGISLLVVDRWRLPFWVAAACSWGAAFALALPSASTLGTVLLLLAASGAATGLALSRDELLVGSAAIGTMGIWLHLAAASVVATEPYLAPVALLLLLVGHRAEREGRSSWEAYSPAIIVLGGGALIERISGGGAGHALVAGAVGLAAVLAGGQRRLAAPLLLGTGLLIAITAYESLGLTAGVPTWAWLALGGTVLLGCGVAMERAETGPLETGRRLVDVVSERFS